MNPKNLIKTLQKLYDFGEITSSSDIDYLFDNGFLSTINNIAIISLKWIIFTSKLKRDDFISALTCYYPPLHRNLLIRVYQEALKIGRSGDSNSLFEFINATPCFAKQIRSLKEASLIEKEEIRLLYQEVFHGLPQYLAILNKLKEMQKAENIDDVENIPLGAIPDNMWTANRKISTKETFIPLCKINSCTFVPFKIDSSESVEGEKFVLESAWRQFLTQLLMVNSEYRAEGFSGMSVRPSNSADPYSLQSLNIFIFNISGKEILLGELDQFVYTFCIKNSFYLFPDQKPEVSAALLSMLNKNLIDYRDNEFILMPDFEDTIYCKLRTLKNQSRNLRTKIKEFIETLRESL